MPTPISQFDYDLPPELIAQAPLEPRDHSRLLVLNSRSGRIEHRRFDEISEYLHPGDVLVFNDTKVFKARLRGTVGANGRSPVHCNSRSPVHCNSRSPVNVEVFLLRAHDRVWEAMIRPGRKAKVGSVIDLGGLLAKLKEKQESGIVLLEFCVDPSEVLKFCEKRGSVPTPPYVKRVPDDLDIYQTVYARNIGSVAAPTAGFHFTKTLLNTLRDRGIRFEYVTLHVGIGTFQPVKTETLEQHKMHSEFVEIDQDTADRINRARALGRRIIAVGTTTTRALEGVASQSRGTDSRKTATGNDSLMGVCPIQLQPFTGDVDIFITPGYKFKIVDALITNFHLPRSTLLALVSAKASRDQIMAAYEEAKRKGYRFYSFGDAMLIS